MSNEEEVREARLAQRIQDEKDKRARMMREDPRRETRLARQQCKGCHYAFRLAGQAFTRYTCRICGGEHMHHNTAVPALCVPCGQENDRCVQCGGPMEDGSGKDTTAPS